MPGVHVLLRLEVHARLRFVEQNRCPLRAQRAELSLLLIIMIIIGMSLMSSPRSTVRSWA
jgi:hypothetical protein